MPPRKGGLLIGYWGLAAALVLAIAFGAAAIGKLFDLGGTRAAVAAFGVPGTLASPFALLLPVAELAVAGLLLAAPTRRVGAAGALALLAVFSAAIAINLARGNTPDCNCFGSLAAAAISWKTLVRNGALGAVAALALAAAVTGENVSAFSWLGRSTAAEAIAVAGVAVAILIAVVAGAVLLSVLRAHGRVLLRVEALEAAVQRAGIDLDGDVPQLGLEPGSTAPGFELESVDGTATSLDDLLEPRRPVMLLFTSTNCGPCSALLPAVGEWQRAHRAQLTIALLADGDRDALVAEAEEHGLDRVLVDADRAVRSAFGVYGTPSAVLVAPGGEIGSWIAPGAQAIAQLLELVRAGAAFEVVAADGADR